MASLTTTITLIVVLTLPGRQPIEHAQKVENLGMCWAMARELAARAEEGPIKLGGSFAVGCEIETAPAVEH